MVTRRPTSRPFAPPIKRRPPIQPLPVNASTGGVIRSILKAPHTIHSPSGAAFLTGCDLKISLEASSRDDHSTVLGVLKKVCTEIERALGIYKSGEPQIEMLGFLNQPVCIKTIHSSKFGTMVVGLTTARGQEEFSLDLHLSLGSPETGWLSPAWDAPVLGPFIGEKNIKNGLEARDAIARQLETLR